MAALVQAFPQQASTVTMLQTRPASASSTFQNPPQGQNHSQYSSRVSQMQRQMYTSGISSGSSYRGQPTHTPVAPYAFTTTPGLGNAAAPRQPKPTPHLRQENRTSSAPVFSHNRSNTDDFLTTTQHRYSTALSVSTNSSSSSSDPSRSQQIVTRDDSALPMTSRSTNQTVRPNSTLNLPPVKPTYASVVSNSLAKPSPDRYRRTGRRPESTTLPQRESTAGGSAQPSGSGMAAVGHLYNHASFSNSSPAFQTYPAVGGAIGKMATSSQGRPQSIDDMHLIRQPNNEHAKRYRRRSSSSLEPHDSSGVTDLRTGDDGRRSQQHNVSMSSRQDTPERKANLESLGPSSSHGRNGSSESVTSARSNQSASSSKREGTLPTMTPLSSNPVSGKISSVHTREVKAVNIPPRGASDVARRLMNPSPLSKPLASGTEHPPTKDSFAQLVRPSTPVGPSQSTSFTAPPDSPAAQQLAALNEKQNKKGSKSRLRRAFSFGSAAELRRASAENNMNNASAERAKLRKERYESEQEAEQAAIVQKQEAGGIGESIYSGQGHIFTGSTDNLSISSTASSASVMIRKMGKGMKKSTRSLVGLFRPKSVVGVPAADAEVPQGSVAQVSMVTVEAEREKVNVNVNPHDQVGGGTGYPRLERNSLDAAQTASAAAAADVPGLSADRDSNDSGSGRRRRSIVGGDRERAEALNAVKKGILKRNGVDSGNSSPVTRPVDFNIPDFNLPQIPRISGSPQSSAPSTPRDDRAPQLGHRRTDSVTIEGEDYFMTLPRFNSGDSRSAPGTPHSMARNISFSPRIQFHDTWTSVEYDRRGEIATCNKLTPMLAQQIKEELNTFKMEMEVHEHSKVYTHFF